MPTLSIDCPEVSYLVERDWRLRHLIYAVGDLEYSVNGTAFSHLAHSVIEQMLSMKVGRAIEIRLKDLCGGSIRQETILGLSVDEIRSTGVSARKAETLHELARAFPEQVLAKLSSMSDDEVRAALTTVRGIGKWTADMYLIFYLERPDVLPVEDGAIRQVFQWLYGAPLTDANVRDVICQLWRPYSSTAVRYMYRALNSGIVIGNDSKTVLGY